MDLSNRSTATTHRRSTNDQAAAAAASLQLLLREDPLLQDLTSSNNKSTDHLAFAYAASLLQQDSSESASHAQRAQEALQDVERKLALVESLAVKLSRTSPEAVAGHLLRLHGHGVQHQPPSYTQESTPTNTTTTLQAIRDRADRLERQAETLESIARRVETSVQKGLHKMQTACQRLEHVLATSSALKRILQWQFENAKLQNYDLEDARDLTRAAASVAVLQDLLEDDTQQQDIAVVQTLRPQALATAQAVRQAAADLFQSSPSAAEQGMTQLGATLRVYYHLGELPKAVWKALQDAHEQADAVSAELWAND